MVGEATPKSCQIVPFKPTRKTHPVWPEARLKIWPIWDRFAAQAYGELRGVVEDCLIAGPMVAARKNAILANMRFEVFALSSLLSMLAFSLVEEDEGLLNAPEAAETTQAYRQHFDGASAWCASLQSYPEGLVTQRVADAINRYHSALTLGCSVTKTGGEKLFAGQYATVFGEDTIPLALIALLARAVVGPCVMPEESEIMCRHEVLGAIRAHHGGFDVYQPEAANRINVTAQLGEVYARLEQASRVRFWQTRDVLDPNWAHNAGRNTGAA